MSQARFDVISIGALSRNLLWKESQPLRTPHATCTLIRAGKHHLLVDPGLPPVVLTARLYERTGLKPEQIDLIFLTCARPAHRAGLGAFPNAKRLIHENEQRAVVQHLETILRETDDSADRAAVQRDLDEIGACTPADDSVAPQVDLFPLPGFTPGTCGLLISAATHTALVAGDAVPTQDHLLAGQVLPGCYDLEAAKSSLQEVYEIADIIIPGHDNVFVNPRNYGG